MTEKSSCCGWKGRPRAGRASARREASPLFQGRLGRTTSCLSRGLCQAPPQGWGARGPRKGLCLCLTSSGRGSKGLRILCESISKAQGPSKICHQPQAQRAAAVRVSGAGYHGYRNMYFLKSPSGLEPEKLLTNEIKQVFPLPILYLVGGFLFPPLLFLAPHPRHVQVPRLAVESAL